LTFDVTDRSGAVLKYYHDKICKFIKLDYSGLFLKSSFEHIVNFSVDKQLMRKLKLMSVTNKIKHNSKEDLIFSIIEKSIIVDSQNDFHYPNSSYYYTSDVFDSRVFNEYDKEMIRENKVITQKNASKMCNQKIKQYNNNRSYRR